MAHGLSFLKPVLLMVVVQILYSIQNIMYKLVAMTNINLNVFVFYRISFAAAVLVPAALILERNKRPQLTWTAAFYTFMLGLFGATMTQNLYIVCLALTSPTFLSAINNLLPGITFVVALCFRLEKLKFGSQSHSTIAKIVGTLVGLGGAMLFTFFRGTVFTFWSTHINLLKQYQGSSSGPSSSHKNSPALGFLAGMGSMLSFALWLILQARMSKIYPSPYSCTALMSISGAIQSFIFALCIERDWNRWKMGWDIKLWTAAYSGICVSGVAMVLMSWCVQKRGPLFVSVFSPLLLLMVALASSLLLEEKFTLGRILGGALIVGGLYIVLWGKSKEESPSEVLPTSAEPPSD